MKKNNVSKLCSSLVAGCALMACGGVHAAITCNLSSNGFSSAYVPSNTPINVSAASFTMTCTRSVVGDSTSQSFTVDADNGLNKAGRQNQAAFGGSLIFYALYTDGSCSTPWTRKNPIAGTVIFSSANDFAPKSQTLPYWGCIPAQQNVPAGTYTDTVTMTPSVGTIATFPVSIITPSSCSITIPAGNLTFNYTSFGLASSPIKPFSANCTANLPYTMALDATAGTSLGLNYTLSLSASSAIGTGVAQNYTIDGSMPAGQTGTCATGSCTASVSRTITITY